MSSEDSHLEDLCLEVGAIKSILLLAHDAQLRAMSTEIRRDKVDAAVLSAARNWTRAGKMQERVAQRTKAGRSTIQEHVTELVRRGALLKKGDGKATEYRVSGII